MSIILNKEELAINELRKDALEILEAGLEAIDTEKILKRKVSVKDSVLNIDGHFLDLKSYEGIFFVGIGKCAFDGARFLESVLGDFLTEGIVIGVKPAAEISELGKIKYFEGTHPLPSEQNIEATKEILKMVEDLDEKNLVICLISGGGSALFELPVEGVTLDQIIEKTKELTNKGADIYELNAARKEMSQVKGGKFTQICTPASVISLIFSDVLGNDISVVASGPTVLSEPSETVKNILICSNADALEAMEEKAQELGYDATIETDRLSGNAKETGKELAAREPKPKSCILFGGETTVKVPDNPGTGGRNQELVLSALTNIKEGALLVSAASDGFDNTDHAGAVADKELREKSETLDLSMQDFLDRGDSYNFFKNAGGAISTGKLESNVSDLCILMYGSR